MKMQDDGGNFCDIAAKTFTFRKYKTAAMYGPQTVDINEEVFKVITDYMTHKPESPFFLCDVEGGQLPPHYITRRLHALYGKPVGIQTARRAAVTAAFPPESETVAQERSAMAAAMGHSVATQKEVYATRSEAR